MRLANVNGVAAAVFDEGGVSLATSGGRFSSSVDDVVSQLGAIAAWIADENVELDPALSVSELAANPTQLGPPVANPSQIFAIGLNYGDHAAETGIEVPSEPMVFTKFASSLGGADSTARVVADTIDWEVELVVVMGRSGRNINAAEALDHIAGFCVGQDISERRLQMASTPAQFSLAKSLENFSPIGPWLTTLDELDDPMDLAIGCSVGDEVLQDSRTSHLIFDIPTLVEYLSGRVELRAGDLIFTGTPAGVGVGRRPRRFVEPGWVITSTIEGLGSITSRFE